MRYLSHIARTLAAAAMATACLVSAHAQENEQRYRWERTQENVNTDGYDYVEGYGRVPITRMNDERGNHRKMKSSEEFRLATRGKYLRVDQLWHMESAGVAPRHAGNISLLSASRFGLTQRLELSTFLVEDVLRPSLHAKLLWKIFDKRYYLTSRFNVANAYPGMALAQRFEVDRIIGQQDTIPLVFEVGHELLFSRAWFSDMNCSDGSVYLIMTWGLGLYGSLNFSDAPDLKQARFHFLANRGETLTGNGFRGKVKYWVDGRITSALFLHGGLMYNFGSFNKHNSLELQAEAEYFFNGFFSAKLGLLASFGNYTDVKQKAGIWPIVDLTWYFGKPSRKSDSLFGRKMF